MTPYSTQHLGKLHKYAADFFSNLFLPSFDKKKIKSLFLMIADWTLRGNLELEFVVTHSKYVIIAFQKLHLIRSVFHYMRLNNFSLLDSNEKLVTQKYILHAL